MSTGQLAAALGVTSQSVRNWMSLGMKPTSRDARGWPLFDLEAARRWRSAFRPLTGHGGTRPGAGRRPAAAQDPLGAMRRASQAEPADPAQLAAMSPGDLQAFLLDPTHRALPLLAGRAAKEQFLAARAAAEAAKIRGDLIPREEAEAAWGEALSLISRNIDALPGRAAPRLVHAAVRLLSTIATDGGGQADAARRLQAELLAILREEIETVRGAIVADPALSNNVPAAASAA